MIEAINWEQMGRDAFAAGLGPFPTADPAVAEAIEGLPVGGGAAEIMGAWSTGWHAANIERPIE